MDPTIIVKIGLAVISNGRLLVVRKVGGQTFILPGGKPEQGESHIQALQRECMEELGCATHGLMFLATFSGAAVDRPGVAVDVHVYTGALVERPSARAEIEELAWIDGSETDMPLAPTISDGLLPRLRADGLLR